LNPAQPPVRPGDILAGKYRVERLLGAGGMGVVVAATHLDLLEARAIKFMQPTELADAEAVERFVREARAASLLKSEHVARVYDVGRLDNGAPYMVMEYLEGTDLSAALKRTGPLPVEEAALYMLQTAAALAEAHGRGIVHRDLKPANLFLTLKPDGTPCIKVLDFGISKMIGAPGDLDITRTQAMLGSPNYMSPEQMHSSRAVDTRSDLWSLGVILYQLVTGHLPFRGHTVTEVVAQVLERRAVPPSEARPGLPVALDRVIFRCLERDLAARYANVGELAHDLLPFAPVGSGPLVESIWRLVSSPSRSATGLPAVLVDSQRLRGGLAAVQLATPATAAATPAALRPPMVPDANGAPPPGSATGAWGSTASGSAFGRSRTPRALLALTFAAAVALGGVLAWTLTRGHGGGTSAASPATSAPAVVTVAPKAEPSVAATATAAPTASASAEASAKPAASASVSAKVKKAAPAPDPFGMDRK
jgi:serine/threonine-protein kinase